MIKSTSSQFKAMTYVLFLAIALILNVGCQHSSSGASPSALSVSPSIAYTQSTLTFVANSVNWPVAATNSGGDISSCTSSPSLPAGLNLDPTTCEISGSPRGAFSAVSYTITATGPGGSSQATVTISAYIPTETMAGVLDSSFGASGRVNSTLGNLYIEDSIEHTNGTTDVLAGDGGSQISLFQITAAGDMDSNFGTGGELTMTCSSAVGNADCQPYNIVLQSDGKMIVVGVAGAHYPSDQFFALRLNPDGSIDTSYGTNGVTLISYSGGVDPSFSHALVEPGSGDLVIAGENALMVNNVQEFYPAMARLQTSGKIDSGFGTGGELVISASPPNTGNAGNIVRSLAYDQNLKAYYLGNANGTLGGVIVRVTSAGVFDKTFGTDGSGFVATGVQAFNGSNSTQGLAVQYSDGSLLIGGGNELQRYTSAGVLDTSFGTSGTVALSGYSQTMRVFVEPSEDILVATGGVINNGMTMDTYSSVVRLSPSGSADSTFGTSGSFETVASDDLYLISSLLMGNGNLQLLSEDSGGHIAVLELQ